MKVTQLRVGDKIWFSAVRLELTVKSITQQGYQVYVKFTADDDGSEHSMIFERSRSLIQYAGRIII
jgi:hypothetical protein